MAKHLVFDYTFDASAKTITLDGVYSQKRMLLITNQNNNEIIFSFNDASKGLSDIAFDYTSYTTTLTLTYDTTSMADTDPLQIFVENDNQSFKPDSTFVDAVSKFRVSNPENLIDTDFEYGLQSTKWETLELTKNIPTFFSRNGDQDLGISSIVAGANSNVITVTTSEDHGLQSGSPIIVVGTTFISADGGFVVDGTPTTDTFTYRAKSRQTITGSIQETYTQLFAGSVYTGTEFSLSNLSSITSDGAAQSTLSVNTEYPTNFTNGTSVTLANTFAKASLFFNTDNVEPENRGVVNQSGTAATASGLTGFPMTAVNAVDFEPDYPPGLSTGTTPPFFFEEGDYTINTSLDTVTFNEPHGFASSDSVVYVCDTDTNTPIGGLIANTGYYVTRISDTVLRFQRLRSNSSFYKIPLNNTGGVSGGQTRSALIKSWVANIANSARIRLVTGVNSLFPVSTSQATNRFITFKAHNYVYSASAMPRQLGPFDAPQEFYGKHQSATYFGVYGSPTSTTLINATGLVNHHIIPINASLSEIKNSFLIPNHGLATGGTVTVTATTGTLPAALTSGDSYTVNRGSQDRFSLRDPQASGADIDFTDLGSTDLVYNVVGNAKFALGDTITIAGVEVSEGYPVTYDSNGGTAIGGLTSGTEYYVARKQGDSFNLATTPNYITSTQYVSSQNIGSSSAAYFIFRTNHGFQTGQAVQYVAGTPKAPLQSGEVYYVHRVSSSLFTLYYTSADAIADTTANRINIISDPSNTTTAIFYGTSIIDLSSVPSPAENQILIADAIGAADGVYEVSGTSADQLSFTLASESLVDSRTFVKVSQDSFTAALDAFYVVDHGFVTGESAVYTESSATGQVGIIGLTSGTTYFLIASSKDFFQVASTQENALAGTAISLTNTGITNAARTGTFSLDSTTIAGSVSALGSVSYEASSTVISGEGTTFTSYFNSGDKILINVPHAVSSTAITAVSASPDYVITAASHGLSDGDTVTITATGTQPSGTVSTYLYFVYTSGLTTPADQFTLANSENFALTGTSPVNVTDIGVGASVNFFENVGATIERTISYVNSDTQLSLTAAMPATAQTGVHYFLRTQALLRSDGFALHRPYDGGVDLIPSSNPDSRMIRQTRKYFRYQSGKGIQVSFAVNFSPTSGIDAFAFAGSVNSLAQGTITTRFPHRLTPGLNIVTSGSTNTDTDAIGVFFYDVTIGVSGSDDVFLLEGEQPETPITMYEGRTYRFDQSDSTNAGYTLRFSTTQDGDNNGGTQYATGVTVVGTAGSAGAYTQIVVATAAPVLYTYVSGTAAAGFQADTPVDPKNGTENLWNATMPVLSVLDDYRFKVQLPGIPSDATALGDVEYYVDGWQNSSLRCGMFDDQNGIFFEYTGSVLNACRRDSVKQISGFASVTFRSGVVNGNGTKFTSQLSVGDYVVIKGQTHQVVRINNDTSMAISPTYAGVTLDSVIISKSNTVRVPQTQWNLDVCDGTGHTGFKLDINKIQMAYLDYSWYGAGKVRFGFKDQNGDVQYVHQFVHGNFKTEAYMRSGNLPARYEIENTGAPTYVPSLAHWGTSVIMDGTFDPDKAYVFNASSNNVTLTQASSLTVDAKVDYLGQYSTNRNYSSIGYAILLDAPEGNLNSVAAGTLITGAGLPSGTVAKLPLSTFVNPYQPYLPGLVSREGFGNNKNTEEVRNLLVVDQQPTVISGTSTPYVIGDAAVEQVVTDPIPLISIRLAPSVDTSTPGFLGEREIINRMQLILNQTSILSTHTAEIQLVLNAQLNTNAWQRVNNPSLSQLLIHSNEDFLTGGASIYNFRASGDTGTTNRVQQLTSQNLAEVATLGNSILGGNNVYPDGPDVLTVVATLQEDPSTVSATNPFVITGRISWSESQA